MNPVPLIPPFLLADELKLIFHLLSIGNKHFWLLAQLSSLKGGTTCPCACHCLLQTMNRLQATLSLINETPAAGVWCSYDDIAVLPARTARAQYHQHSCAPCTVWQSNAKILNLSKFTFQYRVKLQKPTNIIK